MKATRINPISEKQEQEKARQIKLKKQLIMEGPHDAQGFPLCWKCKGRGDHRGLQLIHKKRLSDGGRTSRKNCEIWCGPCHFGPGKFAHHTENMPKSKGIPAPKLYLSGYGHGQPCSKADQVGA